MRINVTQEDIESGVRGVCSLCPIARATRRETLPDIHVSVTENQIRLTNEGTREGEVYWLPTEAVAFVKAFDTWADVVPFEFEVGEPYVKYSVSAGRSAIAAPAQPQPRA